MPGLHRIRKMLTDIEAESTVPTVPLAFNQCTTVLCNTSIGLTASHCLAGCLTSHHYFITPLRIGLELTGFVASFGRSQYQSQSVFCHLGVQLVDGWYFLLLRPLFLHLFLFAFLSRNNKNF